MERVRLAVGLSEAVEELHRLELVHRDLKPSNVLVDAWMGVRLCDLDEVRDGIVTTMHSHTVRSPMYTCPSVGEAGGYGSSADVYSLSLMVGEILVGLPVLRLYAEAVGRVRQRAGVNERSARSEGFCAMGGAVGEERVEVRVRPPVEECMSVGADVKAGLRRWWSPYEREAGVGYCGGDVAAVLRGELERVDASGGAGVGPPSPPPVPVVPSVPPPVAKARHLYAIGGRDERWEELDRVERYDLVSGEWETLSGMGEKRDFSGAAVVRGRICVAGGNDGSTYLSSCTMYDATADTWCALPAMNKGRYSHGLVSVDDCHLYAFGGYGLSCVERLDMGSVLDGVGSVKWIMCPGVMLNPSGSRGRSAFGYCSISGSGDDRDDTYIYCIGGLPRVTLMVEMYSGTVCVVVSGSHWRPSPMGGISKCYLCAGQ